MMKTKDIVLLAS